MTTISVVSPFTLEEEDHAHDDGDRKGKRYKAIALENRPKDCIFNGCKNSLGVSLWGVNVSRQSLLDCSYLFLE